MSTDVLALAGIDASAFPHENVMIRGLSVPRPVALVMRARDLPDSPASVRGTANEETDRHST